MASGTTDSRIEKEVTDIDREAAPPLIMNFTAIGHGHIDLAWLWPIRETKRKAARTFATALHLIERYPDYTFGASQAMLYQWVEEDYPQLFEKIKDKVKEGRWEVQGGTWVESDTNIPSGGESLIRQILYGKAYFKEKFGIDNKVLWLPDTFGYTAALPQIISKSAMDAMMTIKLSWNNMNEFPPHHSFKWQGLDDREILVHMPPEGTYNSPALPMSFAKAISKYKERLVCDKALCVFGIGDGGGGGPGAEHIERLRRQKAVSISEQTSYKVHYSVAEEFFLEIYTPMSQTFLLIQENSIWSVTKAH